MSDLNKKVPALLTLLALSGCATLPSGPSVMVLPSEGKPFEVFQSEDALCRNWASRQVGLSPQENYTQNATTGAAVGTAVGAGVGALLGAASGNPAAGAAIGAGGGLFAGTAIGSENARVYGYEAQRRYDNSYLQCMYAKGNQVPIGSTVRTRYRYRENSYVAPPPPPPSAMSAPSDYGTPPSASPPYGDLPPVPPDYRPSP